MGARHHSGGGMDTLGRERDGGVVRDRKPAKRTTLTRRKIISNFLFQTRGIPPPMGARHHSGGGMDTLGRKRDSGGGMDTLGRKRDGGNVDRRGSQPRPMPAAVGGVGGSTFDPHRDLHIQTLVQARN